MASVTYIALRSLKAGVSSGTEITLDFNVSAVDRYTKPKRSDRDSLGGLHQTLRDHTTVGYRIATSPVLEDDFDDFRQFFDSVDGGETFTLDPYGTAAAPVLPVTAFLTNSGYTERRVSHRYLAGDLDARVGAQ